MMYWYQVVDRYCEQIADKIIKYNILDWVTCLIDDDGITMFYEYDIERAVEIVKMQYGETE